MARFPNSPFVTPPHAYLDESAGTKGTGPYFLWAGYVGTYYFWQRFGQAWNKVLDREPRLEYWHQTDARARNRMTKPTNPFRELTDAQMRRREKSLCRILGDNSDRIRAICVRVSHSDIEAHVRGKVALARPLTASEQATWRLDVVQTPQYIAMLYALKMMVESLTRGDPGNLPMSFHCENRANDPYQDHLQRGWKLLSARDPSRMGSLDFPPGKSRHAPQLQAADMLAWHLNRRLRNPELPDDDMWQVIRGRSLLQMTIPAKELERFVNEGKRWWPIDK